MKSPEIQNWYADWKKRNGIVEERKGGNITRKAEEGIEVEKLKIDKNNTLTLDDYITQQLDSIRNAAVNKARKDTISVDVKIPSPGRVETYKKLVEDTRDVERDYDKKHSEVYNNLFTAYNDNVIVDKLFHNYLLANDKRYKELYNDYLDAVKNGDWVSTHNCIGSLGRYYPHGLPTGNFTFIANPGKYGFKEINKDKLQEGGLVQRLQYGIPYHMMQYNGLDEQGVATYNYANGKYPDWRVGGHNPIKRDNYDKYYTFVGTPQDSIQWKKEYEQKYDKKRNGGTLNYFNLFKK